MTTETLTLSDLQHFTGTEHWYRHGLVRTVLFTDGAKFLADKAEAYWLLDEIAFAQRDQRVANEPFQLWKLTVRPDRTATLACDDGDGNVVSSQELTFTDFPLPQVTLYCIDNIILLPSEY
jgi:hypothetical protein